MKYPDFQLRRFIGDPLVVDDEMIGDAKLVLRVAAQQGRVNLGLGDAELGFDLLDGFGVDNRGFVIVGIGEKVTRQVPLEPIVIRDVLHRRSLHRIHLCIQWCIQW